MDKPTGPCEICGGSGTVWRPLGYGYSVKKCTVCNPKPRDDNYYRDMLERLEREAKGCGATNDK